jgi:hypothetical protein
VSAIPVLLLIGDVAWWRYAERQLQSGFQAWLAESRTAGWKTAVGHVGTAGWPIAAVLMVRGLALQGGDPDIPGGVRLSSDRVALRLDLWRPTALVITFEDQQRLQIGGGPELLGSADRLQMTLPLRYDEAPQTIDLLARNLHAALAGDSGSASGVTIGLLQAHGERVPAATRDKPAANFSISAEAISLPSTVKWPLGPILSSFTIDGTLNGELPLGHGLTRAVTAWRDDGGSMDIRHVALGWGPLGLTGSATLALDDQLQPMGAGTSHIIGYAATLDALANGGLLSRSAATAAKAVLSLLAGTPDDNGPSEVDVPLTLQYRTLSMRQVPLVRLPELDWPAP